MGKGDGTISRENLHGKVKFSASPSLRLPCIYGGRGGKEEEVFFGWRKRLRLLGGARFSSVARLQLVRQHSLRRKKKKKHEREFGDFKDFFLNDRSTPSFKTRCNRLFIIFEADGIVRKRLLKISSMACFPPEHSIILF